MPALACVRIHRHALALHVKHSKSMSSNCSTACVAKSSMTTIACEGSHSIYELLAVTSVHAKLHLIVHRRPSPSLDQYLFLLPSAPRRVFQNGRNSNILQEMGCYLMLLTPSDAPKAAGAQQIDLVKQLCPPCASPDQYPSLFISVSFRTAACLCLTKLTIFCADSVVP